MFFRRLNKCVNSLATSSRMASCCALLSAVKATSLAALHWKSGRSADFSHAARYISRAIETRLHSNQGRCRGSRSRAIRSALRKNFTSTLDFVRGVADNRDVSREAGHRRAILGGHASYANHGHDVESHGVRPSHLKSWQWLSAGRHFPTRTPASATRSRKRIAGPTPNIFLTIMGGPHGRRKPG
jgi:hypothetical protein